VPLKFLTVIYLKKYATSINVSYDSENLEHFRLYHAVVARVVIYRCKVHTDLVSGQKTKITDYTKTSVTPYPVTTLNTADLTSLCIC